MLTQCVQKHYKAIEDLDPTAYIAVPVPAFDDSSENDDEIGKSDDHKSKLWPKLIEDVPGGRKLIMTVRSIRQSIEGTVF